MVDDSERKRVVIGFCDGSGGSPRGSTCAAVLSTPDGEIVRESSRFIGEKNVRGSNNVAEYKGAILAVEMAIKMGCKEFHLYSDSQLIVNQINEEWDCNDPDLEELRQRIIGMSEQFDDISIDWVPREQNRRADYLCTQKLNRVSPKTTRPLPREAKAKRRDNIFKKQSKKRENIFSRSR